MLARTRGWLALLIAVGIGVPGLHAEPTEAPPAPHRVKCPPPSYSCCHYWLPRIYTFNDYHTPPHYIPCPIDPELATVRVERYPCQITSPNNQAVFYSEPSHSGPVVEKTP